MIAILAALVFAAPAGWEKFDSADGCEFFRGPVHASGYPTLRAECVWSDVTPATLDGLLTNLSGHDEIHSTIAEATVVGPAGAGTLVHQRHVATGISDREANLIYTRTVSGDTIKHAWTMAPDQPTGGDVVPAQDLGFWELSPSGTGSKVVYELLYEPGGSVPGFVVRAFQSSGFLLLVSELHKAGQG